MWQIIASRILRLWHRDTVSCYIMQTSRRISGLYKMLGKYNRLPKLRHWIVSMNILTCLASCSISVITCIHDLHVTLKHCRIVAKGMCWLHAVVQFTVIKIAGIRNAFVENTGVKVVPPKHSWRYSARWKQSTSLNCLALSWADRPKPWEVLHTHGDFVSHFKLL